MQLWEYEWNNKSKIFKDKCYTQRDDYMSALAHPMQTQKNILHDIIHIVGPSLFGKEHDLTVNLDFDDFTKQVPIRTYDDFLPWIEKEIQLKGGVLSQSVVRRWLKTSGSTGISKKIPYTEYWMEKYRIPALGVLFANYIQHCPELLSHPYATLDTQTIRDEPTEYLNGIPYQGITNRHPLINDHDWQPPWHDAPWFCENVPSNYGIKMYYRLRFLLGKDLRAILSINPSTLVALKHHLKKNSTQLIKDIFDGTIFGNKINDADPTLAIKLERLLGQNEINFKLIWPNISLISCWTVSSAQLYISQLTQLFPDVKILPFMTCGTEGIVTLPVDDNPITAPLAINQGFYEFLPADVDLEQVIKNQKYIKTLLYKDLELNGEYHLIMSQANGLCRLAIGDIYKVTGFYQDVPRLEFSRRQGIYYSFTGEKITETQFLEAVNSAYQQQNIDKTLFFCCPLWDEIPYYKVIIEIDNKQKQNNLNRLLANKIDMHLSQLNEEYRSKRKSDRLGNIHVEFINPGTIDKYLERQKMKGNATQLKYKIFQKDDSIINEIINISKTAVLT